MGKVTKVLVTAGALYAMVELGSAVGKSQMLDGMKALYPKESENLRRIILKGQPSKMSTAGKIRLGLLRVLLKEDNN